MSVSSSTFSAMGMGSGIDLGSILDQLMSLERISQDKLKSQVTKRQTKISQYQNLNNRFQAMKSASDALSMGQDWKLNKATSSDASVTTTAGTSAISGNMSFKVMNLAQAHVLASSGTVSSLDAVIGSGRAVSGNVAGMGFGGITPSSDLAAGKHTLEVTQASEAASFTGSSVASSTVIDATNNTLDLVVNGVSRTLTLADGTYNQSQLAAEIARAAGGDVLATADSTGAISLSTSRQGSEAMMTITGGTSLSAIGHSAGFVRTGVDGVVKLDGVSTVTNTDNPMTLNSTTGSVTTSATGGLKVGTGSFDLVDFGDGKLSTIVNNINAAKGSMTAAAVQVAPGQYKLQLTSTTTGLANALTIDPNSFSSSALGTLGTVTAAADAKLEVGSGPGAYNVTSTSNTFKDMLPGVTVTATKADPTKLIDITVGNDVDGIADKVQKMVDSLNDTLKFIKDNSKYDPGSKSGGFFQGNSVTARLQYSLFDAVTNGVDGATLGSSTQVGIKTEASGLFTFDRAKFKEAFAANPDAVASLFVEGGTAGTTTTTKPGIAERLEKVAQMATDSVTGIITTAIKGENTTIGDLNKQISRWDDRLAQRQAIMKRQFTTLDTAMARFKSQGNWLAGQIAGLSNGG